MKVKPFVVKGSGPFPLDMLRYDHCWPKLGVDVDQIYPDEKKERTVTLDSVDPPTVGRWNSFGWRVVG